MTCEERLEELKKTDFYKMTVKQLIALYEQLTDEPIGFSVRKKEDIVGAIKRTIRAKQRGLAFSKFA